MYTCTFQINYFRVWGRVRVQHGYALQWRHNERDGVWNHQPHYCSLNRLFKHRSKKTAKLRVTCLCEGFRRRPVNSPHNGPVKRKMFPFDDVIMITTAELLLSVSTLPYLANNRECRPPFVQFLKITYSLSNVSLTHDIDIFMHPCWDHRSWSQLHASIDRTDIQIL